MDGGHRRSIAHLIVGKMLDCIVKGEKEEVDMRYHKPILIRDIQLTIGDEAIRDYRLLQHQDKRYRV
jgi:hypothetical protein